MFSTNLLLKPLKEMGNIHFVISAVPLEKSRVTYFANLHPVLYQEPEQPLNQF